MNALSSRLVIVALLVICVGTACESSRSGEAQPDESQSTAAQTATDEQAANKPSTATPPKDWVETRVDDAKKRLQSSKAGELVWQSLEAHGGLSRWYENGPMYFRFNYQPLGDSTNRDTLQTIDTWSARARHQITDQPETEFGWDGKQAWVKPSDADVAINPRFWALTPYYFIGMPFVLADPGVNLELIGDKKLVRTDETTPKPKAQTFSVVKATFDDGTGDAPDDYYVLYFEPATHELRALRYVVSYPGFFPDGGHSPEKIMFFDGAQTAAGITLAEHLPTHKWDAEAEKPLKKVTDIDVSDLEFRPDTPAAYFEVPAGAKVLEGY
jgi:hypothetical protein